MNIDQNASKKVVAELAKPDATTELEIGLEELFNPWVLFPALYGSYASEFDDCALDVLREIKIGKKSRDDIGAEMFREMLCTSHLCEYGASPRTCFATTEFELLLPELIRRWETYRKILWGDF